MAAAARVLPSQGVAQAGAATYPYRLVDPGTFGGPQSFLNLPAVPLTRQGGLLGTADTAIPDADYPVGGVLQNAAVFIIPATGGTPADMTNDPAHWDSAPDWGLGQA
jgi:hypothetical protein